MTRVMKPKIIFYWMGTIVITIIFLLFFKNKGTANSTFNIYVKEESQINSSAKSIVIVPLGTRLPKSFVLDTYSEIKKFLPDIGLEAITPLPKSAFYKPRGRYRADSLIHWMGRIAKDNQVLIGITNVDISTSKGLHQDWGVMGLAYRPGNAAVASNYRVKNKATFWKIAIHELGHTTGLPHCPVKTCFMRDAEGGDPTGEEKEFCSKCKTVLIKNGWRL